MKFELIQLPYAADALEPAISAETIAFHHGKHLAGYVNTLNSLIEGTELADASLEEIVRKSEGPTFNNAGQTLNHNLYFTQFAPNAGGVPTGKLLAAIEASSRSSSMPLRRSSARVGCGSRLRKTASSS